VGKRPSTPRRKKKRKGLGRCPASSREVELKKKSEEKAFCRLYRREGRERKRGRRARTISPRPVSAREGKKSGCRVTNEKGIEKRKRARPATAKKKRGGGGAPSETTKKRKARIRRTSKERNKSLCSGLRRGDRRRKRKRSGCARHAHGTGIVQRGKGGDSRILPTGGITGRKKGEKADRSLLSPGTLEKKEKRKETSAASLGRVGKRGGKKEKRSVLLPWSIRAKGKVYTIVKEPSPKKKEVASALLRNQKKDGRETLL